MGNIAQFGEFVVGGADTFQRFATNGDGSCALHALFGKVTPELADTDESRRPQLEIDNPMGKRQEIHTHLEALLASGRSEKRDKVMARVENLKLELLAGAGGAALVDGKTDEAILIDRFQILRDKDGSDDAGQISRTEVQIIAILYDIPVMLLTKNGDNFDEVAVWRSEANPTFAMVHSGGAHWEHWKIVTP